MLKIERNGNKLDVECTIECHFCSKHFYPYPQCSTMAMAYTFQLCFICQLLHHCANASLLSYQQ